jgi:hypothetical protein
MVDAPVGAQGPPLLHPTEHRHQERDEPLGTLDDDVGVDAVVALGQWDAGCGA